MDEERSQNWAPVDGSRPSFETRLAEAQPGESPMILADPWERQYGEGDRQFHAFTVFRDLGPERTQSEVSRKLGHNERTTVYEWAKRWQWQKRAEAWDDHVDRVRRASVIKEQEAMSRRQARQAELTARALTLPARILMERIQEKPQELGKLKRMPMDRLMDLVVRSSGVLPNVLKAERAAYGDTPERLEAGTDVARLDSRELVARFTAVTGGLLTALRRDGEAGDSGPLAAASVDVEIREQSATLRRGSARPALDAGPEEDSEELGPTALPDDGDERPLGRQDAP